MGQIIINKFKESDIYFHIIKVKLICFNNSQITPYLFKNQNPKNFFKFWFN